MLRCTAATVFASPKGCYLSRPCCHYVEHNGKRGKMYAREIIQIIQDDGRDVPKHFDYLLLMIREEKWLDTLATASVDELVLDELYENNKLRLKTAAISAGRFDVVHRVLDDLPLTQADFVCAAQYCKDLNDFKLLVKKLGQDLSALSATGCHYVAHGGNTVLSMAAYHGRLELMEYLVDELDVPVTGQEIFVLPKLSDASIGEFLMERMIERGIKVTDSHNRQTVIRSGLAEQFIEDGLMDELLYNVTSEYPGSTPCYHKDGSGRVVAHKYPDGKILLCPRLFNFDSLCNSDVSTWSTPYNGHAYPIKMSTVHDFMVRSFEISFIFSDPEVEIDRYDMVGGILILYNATVSDNTVKFNPIDPLFNGYACFANIELYIHLKKRPVESTYVTDVRMSADMVWCGKGQLDCMFQIDDEYIVRACGGTFGRMDSTPEHEARQDIVMRSSTVPEGMEEDQYVEILAEAIKKMREERRSPDYKSPPRTSEILGT